MTATAAAIAGEVLAALDGGRQIPPFSARDADLSLETAYRAAVHLRALRGARGERQIGRKIGFTNRAIWAQYRVDRPIWGDVYDTTLHRLGAGGGAFRLAGLCEPQIEPEIVFGLSAAPAAGMDDAALMNCIGWAGHGFEIVQSIFPGWRFSAADTVAAGGLHGALLLGDAIAVAHLPDIHRALATFELVLSCDGKVIDRGGGASVLGSPLAALRHLVEELAERGSDPLRAGEIVTTGTLTRAFPVAPGQTWSSAISGIGLRGLTVAFG